MFIYVGELLRAGSVLLCDKRPNFTCEVCRYVAPKLLLIVYAQWLEVGAEGGWTADCSYFVFLSDKMTYNR